MTRPRFAFLRRHRYKSVEPPLDWAATWTEPVAERVLYRQRVNAMKRRLGLLASGDSAYFHLDPPKLRRGERIGPPDFVGIGVQRAGTTWWFDLLTKQPGIYHRPTEQIFKERQILSHLGFSNTDRDQARELYARWFPRLPGTITGEWTPDYFSYSWVPELMQAAAPGARLLLMLRDPVERLLSGIGLVNRLNRGALPPAYVLQDAFQRGLYAFHLRRWLERFAANQILVLQYEQCAARPYDEMKRVRTFLGLPQDGAQYEVEERMNATPREKVDVDPGARERFARLYRSDVADLVDLVPELDISLWPNVS